MVVSSGGGVGISASESVVKGINLLLEKLGVTMKVEEDCSKDGVLEVGRLDCFSLASRLGRNGMIIRNRTPAPGRCRTALAVLALAVSIVAAGCSTVVPGTPQPVGTAQSVTTTAEPAPPPPGTDGIADCFDGACRITVTEGVVIPLDAARLRLETLSVERIQQNSITLRSASPGGGTGIVSTSPGGRTTLNGLTTRVISIDNGTAVLELSPR